ncbi:hypothetical protein BE21_56460 [Sorangium cellulosum]|uniref:Uncharacterized protein n=1 Tax=Sorangium cellulosum TaxID=56 RepID=A0A150TA42_SORCE|nr:hypothetical protein BE21_56460 [Sorangium cellulosum]
MRFGLLAGLQREHIVAVRELQDGGRGLGIFVEAEPVLEEDGQAAQVDVDEIDAEHEAGLPLVQPDGDDVIERRALGVVDAVGHRISQRREPRCLGARVEPAQIDDLDVDVDLWLDHLHHVGQRVGPEHVVPRDDLPKGVAQPRHVEVRAVVLAIGVDPAGDRKRSCPTQPVGSLDVREREWSVPLGRGRHDGICGEPVLEQRQDRAFVLGDPGEQGRVQGVPGGLDLEALPVRR